MIEEKKICGCIVRIISTDSLHSVFIYTTGSRNASFHIPITDGIEVLERTIIAVTAAFKGSESEHTQEQ